MNTKIYVTVNAEFHAGGLITPLSLVWEDGRVYEIDRVLEIRPAASLKAGGAGIRYTVRILGRERYLFYETFGSTPRWFVEGKDAV